jgi:hypothetical protein
LSALARRLRFSGGETLARGQTRRAIWFGGKRHQPAVHRTRAIMQRARRERAGGAYSATLRSRCGVTLVERIED